MNIENINKVLEVSNVRTKLILMLLTKGYSLDHICSLKVSELNGVKELSEDQTLFETLRIHLNKLGLLGIKQDILLPHKDGNKPITRENARMAIVSACKKASVKPQELGLVLPWTNTKESALVIKPTVATLDDLMATIKTIQEEPVVRLESVPGKHQKKTNVTA